MTKTEDGSMEAVFRRICGHLLRQGRRSGLFTDDGFECRYRHAGADGVLMCAVGCLITSEAYDPLMEGVGVHELRFDTHGRWCKEDEMADPTVLTRTLAMAEALNGSDIPASREMQSMLRRLQVIHDRFPPDGWRTELEQLGKELGFSTSD